MIQFHLSKDAAKEMKNLLTEPSVIDERAMQWYLHKVTVARRKCIIAMERQSRYAIAICGLTKNQIDDFPNIFGDLFIRHALISVGGELNIDDKLERQIIELGMLIDETHSYQLGYDRSVTTHINQVVDLLKYFVIERGYNLPVDTRDAALFSIEANQQLRKTKDDKDYFIPMEIFRHMWMGLLGFTQKKKIQTFKVQNQSLNQNDNVIKVDFSKGRH